MARTQVATPLTSDISLPQRLLDLLFPPRCVHCGRIGEPLCAICRATIQPPRGPRCERCDRSLGAAPGPRCGQCLAQVSQQRQVALSRIVVATDYGGATRSSIRALKFRRQRRLAQPLGRLLAEAFQRTDLAPDLVIPMPLHATRRRERGYNQAALLARPVARALGLPLVEDALARVRATQPQTHLHRAARRDNVAGAFALKESVAARALAGKRILLIDDVTTTGATLEAAAEALVSARPAAIYALALARPVLDAWPDAAEPPDR